MAERTRVWGSSGLNASRSQGPAAWGQCGFMVLRPERVPGSSSFKYEGMAVMDVGALRSYGLRALGLEGPSVQPAWAIVHQGMGVFGLQGARNLRVSDLRAIVRQCVEASGHVGLWALGHSRLADQRL